MKTLNNIILVSIIFLLAGCSSPEKEFLKICESQVKNMVSSPSSYKRFAYKLTNERIELEDYLSAPEQFGQEISPARMDILRNYEATPTKFKMIVEFDAANAFGTPTRRLVSCEYFSQFGELDGVSAINMTINGKTEHERLLDDLE